jgi:hypothetical protein
LLCKLSAVEKELIKSDSTLSKEFEKII